MLKIPAKHKHSGIKIWCLGCRRQFSSTGKRPSSCKHKEELRYHLIVHIPGSRNTRKTRLAEARNFDQAMIELIKFKEELKATGFQTNRVSNGYVPKETFVEFAGQYLDFVSGVNTPVHLIRNRSQGHIRDCKLILERFAIALKKKGIVLEILKPENIADTEVEWFHQYLSTNFQIERGGSTYNKHFRIMRAFFTWINDVKGYHCPNPFSRAELNDVVREKNVITKEEFLNVIIETTLENGYRVFSGKRRNLYHHWLPNAYKLALETGCRAEELVTLEWADLIELESGMLVFKIDNLKVNRIQTGLASGKYIRYVPVTSSLMELLRELGYEKGKTLNGYVLARPAELSLKYVMTAISRGFNHYVERVTKRGIQFKDLRKTYTTHLTVALGPNAKMFTGHASDEVLKKHYLSGAYLAGNLGDFRMF
jgi:integrase